ncbi:MAG: sigma-54 dependent transcriptional regulator, acetoin dehydrogenase operon transcriptional, partial [Pseudonocardiales bacterium]|nr:sigma-54 dependent transcriptional regulator, acetoin dehydrogenase operon transcriptional [Pseudonocardiales bacterium]
MLALNNDVVMSNDHLRQLFDPAEQEALIGYAMDTMRAEHQTTARTVELPSGRAVHLRYVPAHCESGPAGGVFRIRLGHQRRSSLRPGTILSPRDHGTVELPGLIGAAPCWTRAGQQVDACYQAGDWLVVEGEAGVGKLALLQAVHR